MTSTIKQKKISIDNCQLANEKSRKHNIINIRILFFIDVDIKTIRCHDDKFQSMTYETKKSLKRKKTNK